MEKTREKISTARSLIAGFDYPSTYLEFVKQFPDDDACLHYLKKLRWPEGFTCPACNAFDEPWHQTRGGLVCRTCQHQTSISKGSVSVEHLQSYLEEFTFRFNRRTSFSRGLVFRRLLEQAVVMGPVTEAKITHGYGW